MTLKLGLAQMNPILGDRKKNLDQAQELLTQSGLLIQKISPYYETKALCRPNETQPDFLNAVFELETDVPPLDLLEVLEKIERQMGRTEKGNWKPRVMDLDILFYGDLVMDSERLKIPHPEISKREFVLKPLCDLASDLIHPVLEKSIRDLR